MVKKKGKLIILSREHKEAMATIQAIPEFKGFQNFLKTQLNNVAILSWSRVKRDDPQIAIKKAYYEGQFDIIKGIVSAFEEAKKGEDEDE